MMNDLEVFSLTVDLPHTPPNEALMHVVSGSTNQPSELYMPETHLFRFNTFLHPSTADQSKFKRSQTVPMPEKRPRQFDPYQHKLQYANLLYQETSQQNLVEHFMAYQSHISPSDALGSKFTLNDSLRRLSTPCSLYVFSYICPDVYEATLELFERGFTISSEKHSKFYKFRNFAGIIVGASSMNHILLSTVQIMEESVSEFDCVSIIGGLQTIVMYTPSNTLRYDLLIALSWMISKHSLTLSCIPFRKSRGYIEQLTVIIVKRKIRAEAKEKLMTVNELFLVWTKQLAMIAYLKSIHDPQVVVLNRILQRRFTLSSKLYRAMCHRIGQINQKDREAIKIRDRGIKFNSKRRERIFYSQGGVDRNMTGKNVSEEAYFSLRTLLRSSWRN